MPVLVDPDFSHLPQGLKMLFGNAAERSFFNSFLWYDVFARFAINEGMQIRLYSDDPDQPSLALVALRGKSGRLRTLSSLASYYSCEHELLWAEGQDPETLAAVTRRLASEIALESPRPDTLSFIALDPAGPAFGALSAGLRRAGMSVRPLFDFGNWYETTQGLSFSHYLDERPSVLVNTWRRRTKKAGNRLRFTFFKGTDDLEEGIAQYDAIYSASWKRSEPYPDFIPALMRACGRLGALRLGICHIGGTPAAAQFWIVWQGRAVIYKLAHDERFDDYSPGTLLTMRMMEQVIEGDHPAEIDFGRGDDPYKRLWLPRRRERWRLVAANWRTPRGCLRAMRQEAAKLRDRVRGSVQSPRMDIAPPIA
jgi:hypothetical protein